MYIPLDSKTRSLGGLSDLTLMAPIKPGLVPSLDSITYKSRLRRVMEVLQRLREASHEYLPFRPVSDSAERVGRIHSFRVAIVEPEDKLLLAVTFDGARESYVRVLWQKIGILLDLLFFHTVGHVPAYGRNVAEWDAWIAAVQVKTDFFYGRPRSSIEDVQFLRDEEQTHRAPGAGLPAELASVRRAEPTSEMRAWRLANTRDLPAMAETARQGIQTLALLHGLTAWFIPGTADGEFLRRAARDLIPEFTELTDADVLDAALAAYSGRFAEAIAWFRRPYPVRQVPPPPTEAPGEGVRRAIQGGILESYAQVTHGALLLMSFKPGADASPFWAKMRERCASADSQPTDGRTVFNVAVTHAGLRAAGLAESELARFPMEFRQGMEDRNSVLGDFWMNHPDRWRLPTHHATGRPIELKAVHLVLQLRCGQAPGMPAAERVYELDDPKHPLHGEIECLLDALAGCTELLAWQPMVRHLQDPANPSSPAIEHFGYVDGSSQPVLDPQPVPQVYSDNLVSPGEFVVGLANAADPAADAGGPQVSDWLRNGSFLVLRKLSQDVATFRGLLAQAAHDTGLPTELVAGKLAGRTRDGDPLAKPGAVNDFDYGDDVQGARCPLHAHIRRANPRLSLGTERPDKQGQPALPPGARLPRIMRRSMSFGARLAPDAANAPADTSGARGTFFMAYNARIAEQFEVVQRWLAGGNSTGGVSSRSDPLIGIAAAGEQRSHVFEHDDGSGGGPKVFRVALDGNALPTVLPDPLVRLEWGMYLFTPSLDALRAFERRAAEVFQRRRMFDSPWSADRGRAAIERLQHMGGNDADRAAAWKAALEDPEAAKDFSAASIWAAVRRDHDGVLRTPYGVLAASHAHAQAVLADPLHYSVAGYRERASHTLGDIYLGLDDLGPGCPYRALSTPANRAIRDSVKEADACRAARELTRQALQRLVEGEQDNARFAQDPVWRLLFAADEVADKVLEGLCQRWFGLPSSAASMAPGRFSWDWQPGGPVPYPGHFLSPSRYIFQPRPGSEVADFGKLHGTALNAAFRAWVTDLRDQGAVPTAPDGTPAVLGRAFFDAYPRTGTTPEEIAREDERLAVIMLGALIGFLPTVQGNVRESMNEWLLDGTFWSMRAAWQGMGEADALAAIREALQRSIMLRPSPEVVWRRATSEHVLGRVDVQAGETVVVAIVSAAHELLEQGVVDEGMVFGGWAAKDALATHACPGHGAAMGALVGIVAGLVECPQVLRPTPFPLGFRVEGAVPATMAAGTSAPSAVGIAGRQAST